MNASPEYPVKVDLLFAEAINYYKEVSINSVKSITRDGYQIWMGCYGNGFRGKYVEIYSPNVVPHRSLSHQITNEGNFKATQPKKLYPCLDIPQDLDDAQENLIFCVPKPALTGANSPRQIELINRFGQRRGFEYVLEAISVESNVPLEKCFYILQTIMKPLDLYHSQWI